MAVSIWEGNKAQALIDALNSAGKVDKQQGSQNAGKALIVGADGLVGIGEAGLSARAKEALLDCFSNVAWTVSDGSKYYNELRKALYEGGSVIDDTVYEFTSDDLLYGYSHSDTPLVSHDNEYVSVNAKRAIYPTFDIPVSGGRSFMICWDKGSLSNSVVYVTFISENGLSKIENGEELANNDTYVISAWGKSGDVFKVPEKLIDNSRVKAIRFEFAADSSDSGSFSGGEISWVKVLEVSNDWATIHTIPIVDEYIGNDPTYAPPYERKNEARLAGVDVVTLIPGKTYNVTYDNNSEYGMGIILNYINVLGYALYEANEDVVSSCRASSTWQWRNYNLSLTPPATINGIALWAARWTISHGNTATQNIPFTKGEVKCLRIAGR